MAHKRSTHRSLRSLIRSEFPRKGRSKSFIASMTASPLQTSQRTFRQILPLSWLGEKQNNKHDTHKHFFNGPSGTIVPRTNPSPVPVTNGIKWRFDWGIQQKNAALSQGQVPVCPGHRPAQNVYVFWFFSCPSWEHLSLLQRFEMAEPGIFTKHAR